MTSEEDLHVVETELARQIGPLARVVVKRAAKCAGTLADLIAKLELEIPTRTEAAACSARRCERLRRRLEVGRSAGALSARP